MGGVQIAPLLGRIEKRQATVGVIGLGYIGLQLLDAFGKEGFPLVGYDIDSAKVKRLQEGDSTINFLPLDELLGRQNLHLSDDPAVLAEAECIVISVPTSIDVHDVPDVRAVHAAFGTVKRFLRPGQLIVLQSSIYPGATEEELLPLLEESKLTVGKDFYLAYVPEISDPGNPDYDFTSIPRMISGVTPACLECVEALYRAVGCPLYTCSSPRVAEAAKVYTNAYRLVNISFANEMKMLFDRMGMDVWEVIEAASQKPFGFVPFFPSVGVGGDCIPVDPNYLVWKGKPCDASAALIEQSVAINKEMPHYVVHKIARALKKSLSQARLLLLGLTYKKDVNGMQESASYKLLTLLEKSGAHVAYHDPYIARFGAHRAIAFDPEKLKEYDGVIIATDHSFYDYAQIVEKSELVIDTHNATKGLPQNNVVKA